MRSMKINQGWHFGPGPVDWGKRMRGEYGERIVSLPHDYMIESDVFPEAASGAASGYYNAGVAHYVKELDIPAEWAGERIVLRLDGTEWIMVIICIGMVISAEMLNTCIERICDLISAEKSEKIRFIKDLSAGAVLTASVLTRSYFYRKI